MDDVEWIASVIRELAALADERNLPVLRRDAEAAMRAFERERLPASKGPGPG